MCGLVIKFRCFVQRQDGSTLITHTCKVQLERFKLLLLRRRRRTNKLHTQTHVMPERGRVRGERVLVRVTH